jgi:glycine cleavage system regulatory protein
MMRIRKTGEGLTRYPVLLPAPQLAAYHAFTTMMMRTTKSATHSGNAAMMVAILSPNKPVIIFAITKQANAAIASPFMSLTSLGCISFIHKYKHV